MGTEQKFYPTFNQVGGRILIEKQRIYNSGETVQSHDPGRPFRLRYLFDSNINTGAFEVTQTHPEEPLIGGVTFSPFKKGRQQQAEGWIKTTDGVVVESFPLLFPDDTLTNPILTNRTGKFSRPQTEYLRDIIEHPEGHQSDFEEWAEFVFNPEKKFVEATIKTKTPYEAGLTPFTDSINIIWKKVKDATKTALTGPSGEKIKRVYLDDTRAYGESGEGFVLLSEHMFDYVFYEDERVGDFVVYGTQGRDVLKRKGIGVTYMFQQDGVIVKIKGLGQAIARPIDQILGKLRPDLNISDIATDEQVVQEIEFLKKVMETPDKYLDFADRLIEQAIQLLREK